MKDYKKYFEEKKQYYIKDLVDRYQDEVINKRGNKTTLQYEYFRRIGFERENIIEETEHKDPFHSGGTNIFKNEFKQDLVSYFFSIESDYPDEGINGFIELEIPRLQKHHIKRYENGLTDQYKADTRFMYDADLDEIFDLIAKHYGYKYFFEHRYELLSTNNTILDNNNIDTEAENLKQRFTTTQKVIAIMLLHETQKIGKMQDIKPYAEFIQFLTGNNLKKISDTISKYKKDNGEIHLTSQKNIKDYLTVKKFFQNIENQKVIELIDKRIKEFERTNAK